MPTPTVAPRHPCSKEFIWYHARRHYDLIVRGELQTRIAAGRDPLGATLLAGEDAWRWDDMRPHVKKLQARDTSAVAEVVALIFERNGMPYAPASPEWEHLGQAVIDAELEAWSTVGRHARGGALSHAEPDSIPLREAPKKLEATITLGEIATRYHSLSGKDRYHWRNKVDTAIRLFEEYLKPHGGNVGVNEIKQSDIFDFIDSLARFPRNASLRYPGLKFGDVLSAAKGLPPEVCLSSQNIRDSYLAALRCIWNFGHARGLIDTQFPAVRVATSTAPRRPGREFEIAELQRLFALPLFVGCKSEKRRQEPGTVLLDDHRYWSPLIALFTGMRAAEIAQLLLGEVRTSDPVPHFVVQATLGRSLKTRAANRQVPIHPELLRLGLDGYVKRTQASGSTRLFPHWKAPTSKRKLSDHYEHRDFTRSVVPQFMDATRTRPNFHSFRHTMKKQMRRCRMHPQHQAQMLGHDEGGIGSRYGRSEPIPLEEVAEEFGKVKFDNLDLSHLYGSRN